MEVEVNLIMVTPIIVYLQVQYPMGSFAMHKNAVFTFVLH